MKNRLWIVLILFCGVKISYAQIQYKAEFSEISYKLDGTSLLVKYKVRNNLKIDRVNVTFVLNGDTLPNPISELSGQLHNLPAGTEYKMYDFRWNFLLNPYFKKGENILQGDLEVILTAIGTKPQIVERIVSQPVRLAPVIPTYLPYTSAGVGIGGLTSGWLLWSKFSRAQENLASLAPIVDPDNDGIINSAELQGQWDEAYQKATRSRKPVLQYSLIGVGCVGVGTAIWALLENTKRKKNIRDWEGKTGKTFAQNIRLHYSSNSIGLLYQLK